MATSLTLRLVENRPLTNQEVDDNFSSLNDNKLELDGTNSMSGKLTTVISSSTRASILMTPGSADPSAPSDGDFWNKGGDFKFYDGTTILTIATTSGDQTLTNKTLTSPIISDGIYFEGTTEDEFETLLTVADPTADRTVSIIDADGDVVLVNSGTIVNDVEEIDSAADLTLDATGDIVLDADGADVILKDGGTEFGRLSNSASELVLKTGTTSQTALTLSSTGGNVTVSGDLQVSGNDIKSSSGDTAITLSGTDVAIAGDLTVNGITTTVNSTTVTIDDPIFTLGGDAAPGSDDNKDRGIEFRWHNGSAAKVGFFGFDDNTGYWTFIPDATNTSEVFSGTKGTLDVAAITGTASAWTTARTLSLTGNVTGSASIDGSGNVSLSTTIASGAVTSITAGTGLSGGTITGTGTIALSHLGIQNLTDPNADRIAFWDDSTGAFEWLTIGSGLSISGTTLEATGSGGTVTSVATGTGLTGGTITTTGTISHADTSTLTGAYGGSGISSITVDGLGHVTAVSTATYDNYGSWTARDGDTTTYTITSGDTLQFAEGTGIDVNFTADDVLTFTNTGVTSVAAGGGIGVSASTGGVTISHSNTSSQSSVNNSGRTFIQDITLDTYGHVTAITSATDSDTYTGTVTSVGVSAGSGLTGGGTITTSGTVTLNIGAGTGIDVAADAISVDVSDFMSNGSNNRVVTATGTDAMNAEANLTFDGSTLAVTGAITATGDVTAYFSDERLKNFTGKIENAVEKVKQLNGYYFTPNETAKQLGYTDERVQVGVSAQEVENVLPEVVVAAPVSDEYKTVQYERMIALLIEAVKEQQEEIEILKKIVSGDN